MRRNNPIRIIRPFFGKNLLFVAGTLLILAGCSANQQTLRDHCLAQQGTIGEERDHRDQPYEVCITHSAASFDEGEQEMEQRCELQAFFENRCSEGPGLDNLPHQSVQKQPATIHGKVAAKVKQILINLEHTGYSHRPFYLQPAVKDLADASDDQRFRIFLDCSGFVGYYVLQGVAKPWYDQLPRSYSCEQDARPLAADFVDFFAGLPTLNVTEPVSGGKACWTAVPDLASAQAGDVIAYLHKENIDSQLYCCHTDHYTTSAIKNSSECSTPNYVMHKTKLGTNGRHLNTGHVLFITGKPQPSDDKDRKGEWVVPVADSTTAPHMNDSRKKGKEASRYSKDGNKYTAWDRRKMTCLDATEPLRSYSCLFGTVERCKNKEQDNNTAYEYQCKDHETSQGTMELNTVTVNSPTGVGSGSMYINQGMTGYRTNYSSKMTNATVVIGRPLTCPDQH